METRIEMSFWARTLRDEELHEIQQKESETLRELLRCSSRRGSRPIHWA
jgi:hypothetical protein